MLLNPELFKNRVCPQVAALVAERLDAAAKSAGIDLNGNHQYLTEVVVDVLVNGAELEAVTDAGRLAASVIDSILTEARAGSGDWVLDLLLFHRFRYGDEDSLPESVTESLLGLEQVLACIGKRRGLKRARSSLKRARAR